jgi:hypothetical protein
MVRRNEEDDILGPLLQDDHIIFRLKPKIGASPLALRAGVPAQKERVFRVLDHRPAPAEPLGSSIVRDPIA